MTTTHPSPAHESRQEFLLTIATLLGCTLGCGETFADGTRPDVLRYAPDGSRLVIGDAKATETPGILATQIRILHYLHWARAHTTRGGQSIILISCGRAAEAPHWRNTLRFLAHEASLPLAATGIEEFASNLLLIWADSGLHYLSAHHRQAGASPSRDYLPRDTIRPWLGRR